MTTTTTTDDAAGPSRVRPALTGIQHVGLTVADVEASAAWYERVLGLGRQFIEPHYKSELGGYSIVLGTPDMSLNIGLDHHPAHHGEPFDPTRTGLDHLCLQSASLEDLHTWAAHLTAQGVEHSGVYAMEGMPISLLTFCDPDGIRLELIAFHASGPAERAMSATGTSGTVPSEVMDEILARHFAAEAAHDRPGILATLTDDAEHEPVGFPGAPFHGHDQLIGFYDVLFDQLEQTEIHPVRRLHGPNFLVDEVQYRGRAFKKFMGYDFGPEGKPVDFRLLHVCEFDGDRISREQVWLDVSTIRMQAS